MRIKEEVSVYTTRVTEIEKEKKEKTKKQKKGDREGERASSGEREEKNFFS